LVNGGDEPDLMPDEDTAWRPYGYYRTGSNVAQFMDEYGYDEYEELVPDEESDVARLWDQFNRDTGVVWETDYETVLDTSEGAPFAQWFVGGELNATRTLLDRWAESAPDRTAYHWVGERGASESLTYADLAERVDACANALRDQGIGAGDVVGIVAPLRPEPIVASLACLKIGAVYTDVFAGYGVNAIRARLSDSGAELVVTVDGYRRSGTVHDLLEKVDESVAGTGVRTVVTCEHLGLGTRVENAESVSWTDFVAARPTDAEAAVVGPDDPALIAYSSGTTGSPKGTIHTQASMLAMGLKEAKYEFDVSPGDVFTWVTDYGWAIVPMWVVFGTLGLGATGVLVGGALDHPSPGRLYDLVERFGVTTLGLSPTAARGLRRASETPREEWDLSTLRILGSVGEPWDRETWTWLFEAVGGGHLPIINISGGTELFGGLVSASPLTPLAPATVWGPEIGVPANVYDEDGTPSDEGYLVCEGPIPGMTHGLTSGDERYLEEYWSDFEGVWNQNDWVEIDGAGYWYVTGRADDTMNVSGRRITAQELEGVILEHPDVVEAAVVAVPDEHGNSVPVGFVVTADGAGTVTCESVNERIEAHLGAPFRLDALYAIDAMPRTQTGKVPRTRIEAAYLEGTDDDVSSLEHGEVLRSLPRRSRTG